MNAAKDTPPIPDALKQYVRDPVAEKFTVEIFEDLHAVLDGHLVTLAHQKRLGEIEQSIIDEWNAAHEAAIERRRIATREQFGALLPFDFIAANVKMEYLIEHGHEEFQDQRVPEDVVEIMQEFLEIVTCRDELEG